MKKTIEEIRQNEDEILRKINNLTLLKMTASMSIYTPKKLLDRALELKCTEQDYEEICALLARSKILADSEVKAKVATGIRADQTIAEHKKMTEARQRSQEFDFNNKTEGEVSTQLKRISKIAELKKQPLAHITPALTKALKMVPTELYLCGGVTNAGKTSQVCYHAAKLLANATKVIIFSNETLEAEYRQRISCLILDLNYSERESFSEKEMAQINEKAVELHNNRLLRIIDLNDAPTTSISSLGRVLDLCKAEPGPFVLFIDYLQKITKGQHSSDSRTVVLEQVMDLLDSSRHVLNGTIIAFTQLWPKKKEKSEFTDRTKWNLSMTDRVDFAIELVRDAKNSAAKLILHKERNTGIAVGSEFPLIFSNGRYLDPSPENIKKHGYLMTTDGNNELVLIKTERETM